MVSEYNNAIRHVGVVGAGTIGASWVAYFMSRGLQVSVYDPDPARRAFVATYVSESWPVLQKLGLAQGIDAGAWTFTQDLEVVAAKSDFIQECAPDTLATKQELFARLDRLVPPHVIVATSTSSFQIGDLQRGLGTAGRFVVAHPFNPPHLIPLVEIVAGPETNESVRTQTVCFFRALGKTVLELRKEITGHIVNRLQAALLREAVWLVKNGIATVKDVDDGIAFGPGLRWAVMGPFLTFHLAAGDLGIRGYLRSLGPGLERIWADLHTDVAFTSELIEAIGKGVDDEARGASISDLARRRDSQLIGLVARALESAESDAPKRRPLER